MSFLRIFYPFEPAGSFSLLIKLAERRALLNVRDEVRAVAELVSAPYGSAAGVAPHVLVRDAREERIGKAVQGDDPEGSPEEVARLRGKRLGEPD